MKPNDNTTKYDVQKHEFLTELGFYLKDNSKPGTFYYWGSSPYEWDFSARSITGITDLIYVTAYQNGLKDGKSKIQNMIKEAMSL